MYAYSKQMLVTGMLLTGVVCISIRYRFPFECCSLHYERENEDNDGAGRWGGGALQVNMYLTHSYISLW